MSEDILQQAKQAIAGITLGKWVWDDDAIRAIGSQWYGVLYRGVDLLGDPAIAIDNDADREFIVAAPQIVRDLITEVERLRAELAKQTPPDTVNPMQAD